MELLLMIGYVFNLIWLFIKKIGYALICGIVLLVRLCMEMFKKT